MSDLINVLVVGILLGGIYSLVSIGLNLIFGVIRVVNFAQGEFVMLGMYATYAAFSFLNMDPYLTIVIVFPLCSCSAYWSSASSFSRCRANR